MDLPSDDPRLRALEGLPYAEDLLRFIRANDFTLQQCRPLRGNPAGRDRYVVFGLTDEHRLRYGLEGDGILALALTHIQQSAWYRTEVEHLMLSELGYRLTQHAVIIFSPDLSISKKCKEMPFAGKTTARAYVPINTAEIDGQPPEDLRRALFAAFQVHGFAPDHFAFRNPVPSDLFGRHSFVTKLDSDLRSLDHGVALLGTRRVGKTSILQHTTERLKASADGTWHIALYDAQPHGSDARNVALRELYVTLAKSARERGLSPPGSNSGTSLHELVRFVLHGDADSRILLAIDELEHLVPDIETPSPEEVEGFSRTLGMLRAIKQEFGQRVSVLVCGTNETFCEVASFLRRPNPIASWFSTYHVKPLTELDFRDMLTTLGRRMGVTFEDEFLIRTYSDFGGHPFLGRQFCSVAVRGLNRPMCLGGADFENSVRRFEREAVTIFKMVLDQLRFFYPSEFDALVAIARGNSLMEATMEVQHLLNYGLVRQIDSTRYGVTMGALARFLGADAARIERKRFSIFKSLGEGAQGTVFHAYDTERGQHCALKVYLPNADKHVVEKEEALLRRAIEIGASDYVAHPIGVVRHGESWALAMEYIEGRTLESILRSRGKLQWSEVEKFSGHLFDALATLLPNCETSPEMRLLNGRELALIYQQGRRLYHRDLKPLNLLIIGDDWNVRIIDFGVSAAAEDASRTAVGTAAYMAPDVGRAEWDASFDLFALARILFRCLAGVLPSGIPDHRECAALDLPSRAAITRAQRFFEKALAAQAASRFQTVSEMRSDWESVLIEAL